MFSKLFLPITATLDFIQKYFKSLIFILILLVIFGSNTDEIKRPNLLKIYLSGEIFDSSQFLEDMKEAKKKHIKGVLLVIDSPGGSVPHSFEIGLAIKELAQKKPVVTYAVGAMASGSYYAGLYSDKIFANPGSMVGSIGVIAQVPNLKTILDKVGVDMRSVKMGEYKEMGTPFRDWSEKENAQMNEMVGDIYNYFVSEVANKRGLDINKSDEFANGRVFIASRAKELNLIDEVGTMKIAEDELIKLSEVTSPVWDEPSEFEKAMQHFVQESVSRFAMEFFSTRLK